MSTTSRFYGVTVATVARMADLEAARFLRAQHESEDNDGSRLRLIEQEIERIDAESRKLAERRSAVTGAIFAKTPQRRAEAETARLATTSERGSVRAGLLTEQSGIGRDLGGGKRQRVYTVEASEMGLAAGEWPAQIDVIGTQGDRLRFYIHGHLQTDAEDVEGRVYETVDSLYRLDVIND